MRNGACRARQDGASSPLKRNACPLREGTAHGEAARCPRSVRCSPRRAACSRRSTPSSRRRPDERSAGGAARARARGRSLVLSRARPLEEVASSPAAFRAVRNEFFGGSVAKPKRGGPKEWSTTRKKEAGRLARWASLLARASTSRHNGCRVGEVVVRVYPSTRTRMGALEWDPRLDLWY